MYEGQRQADMAHGKHLLTEGDSRPVAQQLEWPLLPWI